MSTLSKCVKVVEQLALYVVLPPCPWIVHGWLTFSSSTLRLLFYTRRGQSHSERDHFLVAHDPVCRYHRRLTLCYHCKRSVKATELCASRLFPCNNGPWQCLIVSHSQGQGRWRWRWTLRNPPAWGPVGGPGLSLWRTDFGPRWCRCGAATGCRFLFQYIYTDIASYDPHNASSHNASSSHRFIMTIIRSAMKVAGCV